MRNVQYFDANKLRRTGPDLTDEDDAIVTTTIGAGWAGIVYPNPANDELTIDGNFEANAKISYELYDAIGQLSLKGIFANGKPYILQTAEVSKGIYLLKLNVNGKNVGSQKVTIQH